MKKVMKQKKTSNARLFETKIALHTRVIHLPYSQKKIARYF